jgi:hypothetical protein
MFVYLANVQNLESVVQKLKIKDRKCRFNLVVAQNFF